MELTLEQHGDVDVLVVQGTIHAEDNDAFAEAIDGVREKGRFNLVLDARGLEYLNSRAVGALVDFQCDARLNGGSLVLVAPGSTVKKLLRAVGLLSLVPSYDTIEAAVKGCRRDGEGEGKEGEGQAEAT